ncbi:MULTISPECIES: FeoB-associated Cys-rich membrane protein [Staphylococcus]|uniref:FeoB-associated Cys-rich membrane protein n=1 Tax=Staphylococcus xylosus TaxID=1288 RepID=A0A418ILF2_STAXY|nr:MULTISPECIES: FeoB-associated Cys-rich membrane protein [Staphylococcus]MBF0813619.1 FeoB-associated Cys-rich membrane protein [Staphylococcus saprophyticus]MDW8543523.1 FeoB-associated Cys-rich membrane protein [Staphylococcus sp. KG4-1]MRF34230.1 FeoB-associated Cys-rich membrane protein [Staphylococcus sp. KY49P]MDW8562950.1 FeoB-associated Cys-rich membrane protein [Staphylococcus sp. KG4-3]NQD97858.1 FeoB-associated Cys-rich membrane protein [Staphylococcus xylosus]
MTILINIIVFFAIFSYTVYTLTRFINRSKSGKCNSCGSKDGCITERRKN